MFIIAYNYVNTFSLVLGSLAIYCILMVDYLTLRGWTSLDDVMFYIRGACRAIEFCVTLCMCGYIMMTFYTEMSSVAGRESSVLQLSCIDLALKLLITQQV